MKHIKDFLLLTGGTLLVACGIYFFKFPNNFSTGGVSGISVILGAAIPNLSAGTFVLIINTALLLLGLLVLGKQFGIRTMYCSLLLSFSVYLLERICPMSAPLTNQPLLELVFAVLLPAVGSALLFNARASTGGTDIVAMILRRHTPLNVGTALFCTDAVIAVAACFVFGMQTGLFSILGLLTKALVVNSVIENINISKFFLMVTDYPEEISEYIHTTIHRGATVCDCFGTYNHTKRRLILTVVSRTQAVQLKAYVKTVDPHAFIIISNSSDIIGKGFRESV